MNHAETSQWSKLDTAAKIFPSTSTKRDPRVFRFSCELYETIDPVILQDALDRTVEQFLLYRSYLKKGLFWYYLETCELRPIVQQEYKAPCGQIYDGDRKSLLFEVTYYKKRINLELFHVLSDGTGALHFLRTLVCYYITKKYADVFADKHLSIDYDASEMQKKDDSFNKYYYKDKITRPPKGPRAYRLYGDRFAEYRLGVIEGHLSVTSLLSKVRKYQSTITAFLTSVLIYAIHEGMAVWEEELPVTVTIPVNLRNFFPSESARNFFGNVKVGYNFSKRPKTLESVISHIDSRFNDILTTQNLYQKMNQFSAMEHSIPGKIMPLALKNPGMRGANWLVERGATASLSNVGRVTMPPELIPYIRLFDVFTSTNRLQTTMCSFEDILVISFTSPFVSADVQRRFFRILADMGLDVEITTNLTDD